MASDVHNRPGGLLLSQDVSHVIRTSTQSLFKPSPIDNLSDYESHEKARDFTVSIKDRDVIEILHECKDKIGYRRTLNLCESKDAYYPHTRGYSALICSSVARLKQCHISTELEEVAAQTISKFDESITSEKLINTHCIREFLHDYGSHIFTGQQVLGGVFELVFTGISMYGRDLKIAEEIWNLFSEKEDLYGCHGLGRTYSLIELIQLGYLRPEKVVNCNIKEIRATTIGARLGQLSYKVWYDSLLSYEDSNLAVVEGDMTALWSILVQDTVNMNNKEELGRLIQEEWAECRFEDTNTPLKDFASPLNSQDESSEVTAVATSNDNTDQMLKKLGLTDKYPGKIHLQDVVCIQQSCHQDKLMSVPWNIIKRIIRMDYKCIDEEISSCEAPQADSACAEMASSFKSLFLQGLKSESKDELPNPLDVLILTFACCDSFLQQLLAQKMSMCKLAVPLLVPQIGGFTFCLWPLRTTILGWQNKRESEFEESHEKELVEHAMNVVSFVRIRHQCISKSKLLTDVMGSKNNMFVHYNSPHGKNPKLVSNGTIEMATFLPSAKQQHIFQQELIFLNVRGDVCQHTARNALWKMSSVVVVLVQADELSSKESQEVLQQICESCKLILLITTIADEHHLDYLTSIGKQFCENTLPVFLYEKSHPKTDIELCNEIKKAIFRCLESKLQRKISLTGCATLFKEIGIFIDEDDHENHLGCIKAKEVMDIISNFRDPKSQCFPLQRIWHEFSMNHKDTAKSSKEANIDAYLLEEQEKCRREQSNLCSSLCPIMSKFINLLSETAQNGRLMTFLIKWMKYFLDRDSRQRLAPLRQEYGELSDKMVESTSPFDRDQLRKAVEDKERELVQASLGMEHIDREIGQIYEASKSHQVEINPKLKSMVDELPKIYAKRILHGLPFELMDGDAATVPISWLQAIFAELTKVLQKSKVSVISATGIQSSGKSTMLNAMFGLEFAVSAGRCTRGIFGQLLPVDRFKYRMDYVLVLDTEGLRAPEMKGEKYKHDNALATMVIGLSDFTLINIPGESTSEVHDILEIVIYALLRMKLADHWHIKHQCAFIHQNVTDPGCSSKTKLSTNQQMKELDAITKAAVDEMNAHDVTKFTDVILYDPSKQRHFFPGLWDGNPPCDPVNPSYADKVLEARNSVLGVLAKQSNSLSTISEFAKRLNDIWEAISTDDFVYTFKNSVAMRAYSALSIRFTEIVNSVEDSLQEWVKETAQLELEACLDEAMLMDKYKEQKEVLNDKLDSAKEDTVDILEKFIQTSNNQYMNQWKVEKLKLVRSKVANLFEPIHAELDESKKKKLLDFRVKAMERELLQDVLAAGKSYTDKGKDLESAFDTIWQHMIENHMPSIDHSTTDTGIATQMKEILHNEFGEQWFALLKQELSMNQLSAELPENIHRLQDFLNDLVLKQDHIELMAFNQNWQDLESKVTGEMARVFKQTGQVIKTTTATSQKFNKTIGRKIVKSFIKAFENNVHGTLLLKVKLSVFVAWFATKELEQMSAKYEVVEGLVGKVEAIKGRMFTIFDHTIKASKHEETASDLFVDVLEKKMKCAIEIKVASQMVGLIRQFFSNSKFIVMVHILDELADGGNFEKYMEYIHDSGIYVESWLTKYTQKTFFEKSEEGMTEYATMALQLQVKLLTLVRKTVTEVTNQISNDHRQQKSSSSVMQWWIEEFCKRSKAKASILTFTLSDFESMLVIPLSAAALKRYEEVLVQRLDMLDDILTSDFKHVLGNNMQFRGNSTPYEEIFRRLWGCTEECPFCYEPCSKPEHPETEKHSCFQHRIAGIQGHAWYGNDKLAPDNCSVSLRRKSQFQCKCSPACKGSSTSQTGVVHHPFRKYKKYYPNWEIQPESSDDNQVYWKWFMCTYTDNLVAYFGKKHPDIPKHWFEISKEQAKSSLRDSLMELPE